MSVLELAVNSCPTAFVIIDEKGIIVEINRAVSEIFGYEEKELVGKAINLLIKKDMQDGHDIMSVLKHPNNKNAKVLKAIHNTGKEISIEIRVSSLKNNDEVYVVANILEITEKARLQNLLNRTQKVAKIGSWQVDLKTNKCFWSKVTYQIHEVDPSTEIFVEDGINFYAPEHREVISNCVAEAVQNHANWDVELKIKTATGKLRWVHAIGSPVIEEGEVISLEGTFQDIHDRKVLQLEHERSQRRLMKTETLADVGHWEYRHNINEILISPGASKILGLEQNHKVSLKDLAKLLKTEEQLSLKQTLVNAFRDGQKINQELSLDVDGESKILKIEGGPSLNADEAEEGYFGLIKDLTQVKLEEQRNARLIKRLSLALRASSMGVWEWDIVNDNLVWDDQMYKLYGTSRDAFSGAYDAWVTGLHPDDKERGAAEIEAAMKGEKKFDTSFRVIHPSGKIRNIRAVADILKNDQGEPVTFIGINWDVTEQLEIQKKIEDSNTRYQLMIEGASVGIWDWPDINKGEEIWSSKFYELLGYEDGEIEASLENFEKFLHPDEKTRTFGILDEHFKGKGPFDIEYRLKTKSGGFRWFRGTGKASRDENGNPVRMVGSIQDVHDRVVFESNLKTANQELAQFAYRASHDLKAPLINIRGLADATMEDIEEKNYTDVANFNREISGQAKKLEKLVNDMLSLTKAELKNDVTFTEVNFNEITENVKQNLEYSLKNLLFQIETVDDSTTPFIGSEVRLTQVIENLVSNSIKYRDPDEKRPFSKIHVYNKEGNIILEVSDNGLGFPADQRENLFGMFQRFHPKVSSGTGLGLYMIKKHIEKLNGTIELLDTEKKGSTFQITLPIT